MSVELVLAATASLLLVAAILRFPIVAARLELRRLRERYELTDEELEAYVRELPEACHAIATAPGDVRSAREIRRMASDTTIVAILRRRRAKRQSEVPPAG